jgi:uncharacterized protein YdeI (BOF family)
MKKLALVLATTLVSTPAMAGPYVNVETKAKYGEVSFAQVEDADNTYGTKLGIKYSF